MAKLLSNQPPRGMNDWMPEEFQIRKYIFDTWREVCVNFGYQEYLTPILENAEIYRAKSGEDIGGKELMVFTDVKGRELAIRPEMTPSIMRLASQIYARSAKPMRLFSIANFVRNERPQKGRNREFWQLNYDILGSESPLADLETIQIAIEIMLAFNAPKNSFKILINNRKLIDEILNSILKIKADQILVLRLLDKAGKIPQAELEQKLLELKINKNQVRNLLEFLEIKNLVELKEKFPELKNSLALKELDYIFKNLENLGYASWIEFSPKIIRGFDYYDGIVFEIFDQNKENSRALFGGGRYNGLGKIFGLDDLPAVGCAPGDETTRIFLENWGLLKNIKNKNLEKYYLPILSKDLEIQALKIANILRQENKILEVGFNAQKINKALEYANKKDITKVIILGEEENKKNIYKIKNMKTGKEEIYEIK